MDVLMMGIRDLMGFHADLVVQTAVWVALWAVGLWVLRVRAGALQYAAWLIALGAIPLFPLIGGPVSRIVRMTDMVPVFTIPRIVPVPDVQPVSPADRSEAQKSEVRGPEVRGQGRVARSTEVSSEAWRRSVFDALPSLSRSNLLAMIGSVWLAGVLVMLLRMMLSYRALLRIRRRARVVSDSRLRSMLEALRKEIGIGRSVRLAESDDIPSPISHGWRRPVILLPASLLGSMPHSEIRWVLAHELAHIRRLDFVVMLFQRILEAFFFYHPMVWFASNRLTLNREHACDDWVVSLGSHRKEYAMNLIGFMQPQDVPKVRFASALFGRPGKLARRITMITNDRRRVEPSASRWAVVVTALVAVLGLLWIGSFSCVSRKSVKTQPAPEVQTLLDQAEEVVKSGRWQAMGSTQEDALQLIEDALVQAEKLPTERARKVARMHALAAKADYMPFSMDQTQQIQLYEEALLLARELGDRSMEARMTQYIAIRDHSDMQGRRDPFAPEVWIRRADKLDKAVRLFRSAGDRKGEGEALQWKAGSILTAGRFWEAKPMYRRARGLLLESKSYPWAAGCDAALEFISHVEQLEEPYLIQFSCISEMLQREGDAITYAGQPGGAGGRYGKFKADEQRPSVSPFYEAAVMKEFVKNSRRPGDTWSKDTFSYGMHPLRTTGTIVSDTESVTVPAGTFAECRRIRMETENTEHTLAEEPRVLRLNSFRLGTREVWYAPGVGMVKLRVERGDGINATFALKEYTVQQKTRDYLPLAIGNRWVYGLEDIDPKHYLAEHRLQVRFHDEEDIYYLSHYRYMRCIGEPFAKSETPSRTIEAEHTPQDLPPDTEPSYVIAHARIVQWMERARFTAQSGECVRVLVGENKAGVRAIQVTPTVRQDVVHFHFDAIGEEGKVVAAWDVDKVKPGAGVNSASHSELKPEYLIKVQTTPDVSADGEVTVDFRALFAISPTREEWDQWYAQSGKRKRGQLRTDMQTMSRPILFYLLAHGTSPESLEAVDVELLSDVYGKEGDHYRCDLHKKGFVLYSCGKDGQYDTDDDEVRVFMGNNTIISGDRADLYSDRPGGGWLPLEESEGE